MLRRPAATTTRGGEGCSTTTVVGEVFVHLHHGLGQPRGRGFVMQMHEASPAVP